MRRENGAALFPVSDTELDSGERAEDASSRRETFSATGWKRSCADVLPAETAGCQKSAQEIRTKEAISHILVSAQPDECLLMSNLQFAIESSPTLGVESNAPEELGHDVFTGKKIVYRGGRAAEREQ